MTAIPLRAGPPAWLQGDGVPLVSVLICNFNYGRYIGEAVESALRQTWEHMEVLVVDDGSTDDSRSVLAQFGDRVRVIHKENGGQASAFNVGIAEARGEIICFLDSDDLWYPDKVSRVVVKFRDSDWGMVCHDLDEIDGEGRALGTTHIRRNGTRLEEGNLYTHLTEYGFPWVFGPTSGISLRADVARSILPLPEADWRTCADNLLVTHALCHAQVGALPVALGQYRYHGSNAYSVIRLDHAARRAIALIGPTRRYFVMRDHLARNGVRLDREPKDDYFFFRRWVFMTQTKPWKMLGRLWSRNRDRAGRGGGFGCQVRLVKFLGFDLVLVVLSIAGFRSPYDSVRSRLASKAGNLDSRTRRYLLGTDS